MVNIIYLICTALIGFSVGAFLFFVMSKLRKKDSQTDSISKHHWNVNIYMDDIPQNEQNILHLGSVPLKIYETDEYLNFPVPHVGEEVGGVYYSDHYVFDMSGIVTSVYYNTDIDLIVVACKCTYIHKK